MSEVYVTTLSIPGPIRRVEPILHRSCDLYNTHTRDAMAHTVPYRDEHLVQYANQYTIALHHHQPWDQSRVQVECARLRQYLSREIQRTYQAIL